MYPFGVFVVGDHHLAIMATVHQVVMRRGAGLLPPSDLPEGKVDLTCAAPAPGPGLLSAYR